VNADEEIDEACGRLWDLLPMPVVDLADKGMLVPAGLLIGNGLARVKCGVLMPATVAEQLAGAFALAAARAASLQAFAAQKVDDQHDREDQGDHDGQPVQDHVDGVREDGRQDEGDE